MGHRPHQDRTAGCSPPPYKVVGLVCEFAGLMNYAVRVPKLSHDQLLLVAKGGIRRYVISNVLGGEVGTIEYQSKLGRASLNFGGNRLCKVNMP